MLERERDQVNFTALLLWGGGRSPDIKSRTDDALHRATDGKEQRGQIRALGFKDNATTRNRRLEQIALLQVETPSKLCRYGNLSFGLYPHVRHDLFSGKY